MKIKSSKSEINYRLPPLPEHCCANCESSYYNTYQDACCKFLLHEDILELRGICDYYTEQSKPVDNISIDSIIEQVSICKDCKHSYYDSNYMAKCSLYGEEITEDHSCDSYEKEN